MLIKYANIVRIMASCTFKAHSLKAHSLTAMHVAFGMPQNVCRSSLPYYFCFFSSLEFVLFQDQFVREQFLANLPSI